MKPNKTLLRWSVAALCALSAACSSGSTGTSSSSTGGSTSSGTSNATASSASTSSCSQAVASGAATSTVGAAQSSSTGVATLVRAQHAVRNLASGGPSRIEGSYDFGPETFDCDEDGSITMSGSETYSISDDFTTFSMDGDFSMEFDTCTEDVIVEAEDGFCLLTGSMDGGFDTDFTFESDDLSSEEFSMTMDMVTQDGGLDMTVYGQSGGSASVNVEFDLHAEGTNASDEVTVSGTFNIDGVEYDAGEEIDTTVYTMEELDCVQVEDADNNGEEDAEPGEEGYDFEDDETDDDTGGASDGTMSFFAASEGNGVNGGNFGGLSGADSFCQDLIDASSAPDEVKAKTWRAYLCTSTEDAKNRIGNGPWFNFNGDEVAADVDALHASGISGDLIVDENGEAIPTNEHDMLTGCNEDGEWITSAAAFPDNPSTDDTATCDGWTSSSSETYGWVGHTDWDSEAADEGESWTSVHNVQCDQAGLNSQGGNARIYCFAED